MLWSTWNIKAQASYSVKAHTTLSRPQLQYQGLCYLDNQGPRQASNIKTWAAYPSHWPPNRLRLPLHADLPQRRRRRRRQCVGRLGWNRVWPPPSASWSTSRFTTSAGTTRPLLRPITGLYDLFCLLCFPLIMLMIFFLNIYDIRMCKYSFRSHFKSFKSL